MPKVSDEELCKAAKHSNSMLKAARNLGIPYTTFIRRAKRLGVYSPNQHEIGVFKGGIISIPLNEILEGKHPTYKTYGLKCRLFKEGILKVICDKCGVSDVWEDEHLALHLDHKNGINNDHRLENLQVLCPNCHSQTLTYCGKNKRVIFSYTDKELTDAFDEAGSLVGACMLLGISRTYTYIVREAIFK